MEQEDKPMYPETGSLQSRLDGVATQPTAQPALSCSDGTSSDSGASQSSSSTDRASNSGRKHNQQHWPAAGNMPNPTAAVNRPLSQQRAGGLADLSLLESSLQADSSNPTPAKDLADVSHRLKKLERAVKAHLLAGQRGLSSGGASILASASGAQQQSILGADAAASFGSPVFAPSSADGAAAAAASAGPRLSERVQLRETLSGIKTDIADLAVRQVEAQMLQQRVLRLEAVIAGMGGLGALTGVAGPAGLGMASGLSSFAGSSVLGAAAAARPEAQPRLTRTPSGESEQMLLIMARQ